MGTAFSSFLIATPEVYVHYPPSAASAYASGARMDHNSAGHAYTIGIEEELMIVDGRSLDLVNAIEAMLEPAPAGEIKPELMESVLEVSTDPCANVPEAGDQLRALRRHVCATATSKGMAIGSAGTHPFAVLGEQRIRAPARRRHI